MYIPLPFQQEEQGGSRRPFRGCYALTCPALADPSGALPRASSTTGRGPESFFGAHASCLQSSFFTTQRTRLTWPRVSKSSLAIPKLLNKQRMGALFTRSERREPFSVHLIVLILCTATRWSEKQAFDEIEYKLDWLWLNPVDPASG